MFHSCRRDFDDDECLQRGGGGLAGVLNHLEFARRGCDPLFAFINRIAFIKLTFLCVIVRVNNFPSDFWTCSVRTARTNRDL